MKVYQLYGGHGAPLFATKQLAEEAKKLIPKEWGRAFGRTERYVREIEVHTSLAGLRNWTGGY